MCVGRHEEEEEEEMGVEAASQPARVVVDGKSGAGEAVDGKHQQ